MSVLIQVEYDLTYSADVIGVDQQFAEVLPHPREFKVNKLI